MNGRCLFDRILAVMSLIGCGAAALLLPEERALVGVAWAGGYLASAFLFHPSEAYGLPDKGVKPRQGFRPALGWAALFLAILAGLQFGLGFLLKHLGVPPLTPSNQKALDAGREPDSLCPHAGLGHLGHRKAPLRRGKGTRVASDHLGPGRRPLLGRPGPGPEQLPGGPRPRLAWGSPTHGGLH